MNQTVPLGFEVALVRVAPVCPSCSHIKAVRAGKNSAGHQRYLCRGCAFRFVREPERSPSSNPQNKPPQLVLPVDFRLVPPPRSQRFSNLELLRAYRYCPQQWISDRLVQQNIKLVHKITHAAARKTKEPYEDLLQEGVYGLMRAIARFDPERDIQFSTYAQPFIRGRISQYLRDRGNTIKMPRTLYELAPREQRVRHSLQEELGRSPTDGEVAARMEVEVRQIRELKEAKRNTGLVSLDVSVGENDGQVSLGEAIAALEPAENSDLLGLLEKLEPSDRALFYAVYVQDKPKKHVAATLGKSVNWLNQRIQAGLSLLREAVAV